MAQPKKKTSHQKQAQRRAKNYFSLVQPTNLTTCPNCKQPARQHQMCAECGYYNGRPARRADNPGMS